MSVVDRSTGEATPWRLRRSPHLSQPERESATHLVNSRLTGCLETHTIASHALRGNALSDPADRPVLVYTPPAYERDGARLWPTYYVLHGSTITVDSWLDTASTFIDELDQAIAAGTPGSVVVFVDAWTSVGGSQYLDSPLTGRYQTYVAHDVVRWVESHYRVIVSPASRAISGHSSGGFGALNLAINRPDLFSVAVAHSPDTTVESAALSTLLPALRVLNSRFDGSVDSFFHAHESVASMDELDLAVLDQVMLATCYERLAAGSENPRLLFDPASGRLQSGVLEAWRQLDLLSQFGARRSSAGQLTSIYLDVGDCDEFYSDLGCQSTTAAALALGFPAQLITFAGGHHEPQRFLGGYRVAVENLAVPSCAPQSVSRG